MNNKNWFYGSRILTLLILLTLPTQQAFPDTTVAVLVELSQHIRPDMKQSQNPLISFPWKSITLIPMSPEEDLTQLFTELIKPENHKAFTIQYDSFFQIITTQNNQPYANYMLWSVTVVHDRSLTASCIGNLSVQIIGNRPEHARIYQLRTAQSGFEVPASGQNSWQAKLETRVLGSHIRILLKSVFSNISVTKTAWRVASQQDPITDTAELANVSAVPFTGYHSRQDAIDLTPLPERIQSFKRNITKQRRRSYVPEPFPAELIDHDISHFRQSSSGVIKDEQSYSSKKQLIRSGLPRIPNPYSWKLIRTLGSGGFSSIALAAKGREKIAIKRASAKTTSAFHLLREAEQISRLTHECIIKIIGIAEVQVTGANGYSGWEIWLGLTFKSGGNLWNIIEDHPSWLTDAFIKTVISRLVTAVTWTHQNGIVHRDIKPDNILFDNSLQKNASEDEITFWIANSSVLSDYGLASPIEEQELTEKVGTIPYRAPELNRSTTKSYKAKQIDTWGIGSSTYAAFYKNDPYSNYSDSKDDSKLMRRRNRADFKELSSKEVLGKLNAGDLAKDFMAKCCIVDPEERSTPEQLQNHYWLTGKSSNKHHSRKK